MILGFESEVLFILEMYDLCLLSGFEFQGVLSLMLFIV